MGEIEQQRNWAFGGGMHSGLGMHLARLEMAAFLTEWLRLIPQLRNRTRLRAGRCASADQRDSPGKPDAALRT